VIFHSDRGTRYTSGEFAEYCTRNNIRRSLGKTGICFDNAVSESFFATYKKGNWSGLWRRAMLIFSAGCGSWCGGWGSASVV
jgi:transposase InsO family protein